MEELLVLDCYLMATDFVKWLTHEIDSRDWNQSILAERASISTAQMSRIFKRERLPGIDAITGIARALGIPTETVMRAAGWLPAVGEVPDGWVELGHRLMRLSGETRARAIQAMEGVLVAFENATSPGRR